MGSFIDPSLCWDDIPFLRRITRGLPLVLKGVTSAADVKLAWEHGLEGVLLSNHGGRNLDTAPAAIITLLECHRLCPHVFGGDQPNPYNERGRGFEILVDGGIRRGTDVLKCLALGARAVGLGRPVLFANAYGQEGVEKVVEILREELEGAMRNCGVRHLKEIGPELVNTGEVDGLVPAGWGHGYVRDWRRAKL